MQQIDYMENDGEIARRIRDTLVGPESEQLQSAFDSRLKEARQKLLDEKIKELRVIESRRIGRNDPCPCGSNAKFKKCCGRNIPDDDSRFKE